jgi:hypothetical protein
VAIVLVVDLLRVRVLDTLGVDSLNPLIAPMVIDSHELQQAVFESDLPAQMLGPLDELGVTGLAVIPGELHRIVGSEHAFLAGDDFTAAVIASFNSQLGFETYEAPGATPRLWPAGAPLSEFDAIVAGIGIIPGRHWELEATAVTVNANVWVRPWVVVINPDVFESLSAEHQQALREAAPASTSAIIEATREEDRKTLKILCESELEFVTATDKQLDGMRAALEPVYASIASDPQSAEYLDEIVSLKEQLGVPPDAPNCEPEDAAGASQPSQIDGVYTRTLTGQDVIDAIVNSGCDSPNLFDPAELSPNVVLVEQITLEDGRIEQLVSFDGDKFEPGFEGTYDMFRDRVEIRDAAGAFTVQWTFDGTNLVLSDIEGGGCDDEVFWTSFPGAGSTTDRELDLSGRTAVPPQVADLSGRTSRVW